MLFHSNCKRKLIAKKLMDIYHNDTYYMHRYLCDVLCFLSSGFVDVYARDHDAVQQHAEKILKVWTVFSAITSCWQIKREEERWQIKNYFRTYAQFNCIRNCNRIWSSSLLLPKNKLLYNLWYFCLIKIQFSLVLKITGFRLYMLI